MLREKKSVELKKLAGESRGELKEMLAELCDATPDPEVAGAKPSRWSRRFAASGKSAPAAIVRS
jgi:hypothetical protein